MSQATTTTINRRRVIVGFAAALLVSAPVASTMASAADARTPDALDAAIAVQRAVHQVPARTDFRSPDARDAVPQARAPRGDAGYVGLRTPATPALSPIAPTAQPAGQPSTSGFAWSSVALLVALAAAAGIGLNAALRRRRLGRLLTPRS
jgi:hypothetical protein